MVAFIKRKSDKSCVFNDYQKVHFYLDYQKAYIIKLAKPWNSFLGINKRMYRGKTFVVVKV